MTSMFLVTEKKDEFLICPGKRGTGAKGVCLRRESF